jgi:hypothetical protein
VAVGSCVVGGQRQAAILQFRCHLIAFSGHVVVSPPGELRGFINTGPGELRLTAIHGAARFRTEWLSGADPVWSSTPRAD